MQWRRITVTCLACGKTVVKNNHAETCSIQCREALRRLRHAGQSAVGPCEVCGVTGPLIKRVHGRGVCGHRCASTLYARLLRRPARDTGRERIRRTGVLGTTRPCLSCAEPYQVRRYDQRFCSIRCRGQWEIRHGNKGIKRRAKAAVELARRNKAIGRCALCRTSYRRLRPSSEMGRRSANGKCLFHWDHCIPKSRGGADHASNRRYLCWFCNHARMDISESHDAAIAAAGRAFWKAVHRMRPHADH